MENEEILTKILGSLERIETMLLKVNNRLELLEETKENSNTPHSSLDIVNILQNIDENLIPTIRALLLSNGGNAEEIAAITGRSRTRENQHLNKLFDLNYIEKLREGREIKYKVKF